MEKRKIIGYNLTETQYKETVLKLLVEGEQLGRELGFEMDLQKQGNIDKFNELGLLDKWFEPVYEKWYIITEDSSVLYGGDEAWTFLSKDEPEKITLISGSLINTNMKIFSTKEAAENYMLKIKCIDKLDTFKKGDILYDNKRKEMIIFETYTFYDNYHIVFNCFCGDKNIPSVLSLESFLKNIEKVNINKRNEKLIQLSKLKCGDVFRYIGEENKNVFIKQGLHCFKYYYWDNNNDPYFSHRKNDDFVLKINEKEENIENYKIGDWLKSSSGNIFQLDIVHFSTNINFKKSNYAIATTDEIIEYLGVEFSKLYDGEIKVTYNGEYFTVFNEKREIIYRTF